MNKISCLLVVISLGLVKVSSANLPESIAVPGGMDNVLPTPVRNLFEWPTQETISSKQVARGDNSLVPIQ